MNAQAPGVQALPLQARGLCVRQGGAQVLHGVDATFAPGRWTAIAGPNGAGKSTLLRALAGLLPASAGEVLLADRPLPAWGRRERACALAWLGQSEAAADTLTAWDVALLGRLPHRPWLAPPCAADTDAAERALRATQMWPARARRLGELSGGERQRALLARALAAEAPVLLLDEPLNNLDPSHQADWLRLARALAARGHTVVSVLHDLSFALRADHLLILSAGRVTHQGPCTAAPTRRALEQVFNDRVAVQLLDSEPVVLPRP